MADENIPESLKGYFQKESAPPATEQQVPASLQNYLSHPTTLRAAVGYSPNLADPESPLSPVERAVFGWAAHGEQGSQRRYLEDKFGKGNVDFRKMDDDAYNYVVKSDDGKWHQVDPHGISDIPSDLIHLHLGDAAKRIKDFSMSNTLGGVGQFLGEKGPVAMAAGTAGAEAFGATAPLGAAGGPVGMFAAGLMGAVPAGMAAGAAMQVGESGVRKTLSAVEKASGMKIPGSNSYENLDDLKQQIMGSMIFGGAQEMVGPFMRASAKGMGSGAATLYAKTLGIYSDNPESVQSMAWLQNMLGGQKEAMARAMAKQPLEVMKYFEDAKNDATMGTSRLLERQKGSMDAFVNQANKAQRALGRRYDVIDEAAKDSMIDMKNPDANGMSLGDLFSELKKEKYLDDKGQIVPNNITDIGRNTGGNNGAALKKLVNAFEGLNSRGGNVSYPDAKIMRETINDFLQYGDQQVTDPKLSDILGRMQNTIKNKQAEALNEIDPNLADSLVTLNDKYGAAKDFLKTLNAKSTDQRLDAFIKQIKKDDGTYNAKLLESVGNLLGVDNPTNDILHMEAARDATAPLIGRVKVLGLPIPQSPRGMYNALVLPNAVGAGVKSTLSAGADAISDNIPDPIKESFAAALKKTHSVFQTLGQGARENLVKNPQAIQALGDIVSGSVIKEQQDTKQLLNEAGAFQDSQFKSP